ncbi:hypothetical protein GCM10025868_10510 [Angustibacter aerolatus]|uniref:Short-chain dehydrogenase n=1 Tax=Angustibacter aerolatus TaxID=1162965 RepID=A0ABQ6JDZ3_9ACTN|nr:SDR family NAD(P)-dependent oxidoreductase [Angustibacter aerolatus]GMA85801.1 hypothetical protein GCM10025868_10510 [Angustibacter aerolatus]
MLGVLQVVRAFAPVLERNGGGAVVDVLSALSWLHLPGAGAYGAAKAAEWAMGNALRQELAEQGTSLTALHVGYMDTDMTAGLDVPKADPALVARATLDGVEAGEPEVLADDTSRGVKSLLSGDLRQALPVARLTALAEMRVAVHHRCAR